MSGTQSHPQDSDRRGKLSIWIRWVAPAAIPLAMAANLLRPSPEEDVKAELRSLKAVMPEAQLFSEKGGSPPYYRAYRSGDEGRPVGLCFATTDVVPEVVGYAGPVKLMVGMDSSGVITGVEIIEHNETPSYIKGIYEPRFTDQFEGKSITEPFQIGEDLDGITRATVTVEAIYSSVREGGRRMAKEVLGLQIPGSPGAPALPWMDLVFLMVIAGVGTIGFVTSKRLLRYVTLVLVAILLGFLRSTFLSAVNLSNSLLLRFPPFRSNLLWWVLVGVAGVIALLFGRVYCGWLCPFGAVEEFLGRLRRPKLRISQSVDWRARALKYWVLWGVLILSLLLASSALTNYEPFATLFNLGGRFINWVLVAVVLMGALLIFRFWCRYFCPVGAILALVSRVSLLKLRAKEACPECRICVDVCPVGAIVPEGKERVRIDAGECIQCNECIVACPRGILTRKR